MNWRARPGRLPVFWQTLGLLVFALVIAQTVAVGLSFFLPPPRPDFSRLSDIAATLGGTPMHEDGEQLLLFTRAAHPPAMPAGLVSEPALTRRLAERLDLPEGAVRLFREPDRRRGFPFGRGAGGSHGFPFGSGRGPRDPARWRDPILFGRVVAAAQHGDEWRIVASVPPPLFSAWQRRIMLWFAVGALALVPLAWSFARAISRPIRRFAEAADRLGADPQAPALEEEGAAEIRVAARALNRMQGRIADHLAERTAMIGAIAHDLRTPLARIAFRVEPAPEPMRERVLADVAQMRAMISATIGFVRSTSGEHPRVPVDLAALVRALAEQERDMARPVTLGRVETATVAGDPIPLERLIQNLVDNGIAYAGGVEIAVARDGAQVVLTAADRGPGLAPELLQRVFQPFARGDPSRNRATGGIGLGLTIARAVAEDHGGTLHLANRDGGGLQATLSLPAI